MDQNILYFHKKVSLAAIWLKYFETNENEQVLQSGLKDFHNKSWMNFSERTDKHEFDSSIHRFLLWESTAFQQAKATVKEQAKMVHLDKCLREAIFIEIDGELSYPIFKSVESELELLADIVTEVFLSNFFIYKRQFLHVNDETTQKYIRSSMRIAFQDSYLPQMTIQRYRTVLTTIFVLGLGYTGGLQSDIITVNRINKFLWKYQDSHVKPIKKQIWQRILSRKDQIG